MRNFRARVHSWLEKHFDLPNLYGGVRTLGALLIGNSIVIPLLTNGATNRWWISLLLGIAALLATSQSKRGE